MELKRISLMVIVFTFAISLAFPCEIFSCYTTAGYGVDCCFVNPGEKGDYCCATIEDCCAEGFENCEYNTWRDQCDCDTSCDAPVNSCPTTASCPPDTPQECDDGTCCPLGDTCCGDGRCCPNFGTCCDDGTCCSFGATCCGDGRCCPNYGKCCADGTCCSEGTTCCGGDCCSGGTACCNGVCCNSFETCCGGACCQLGRYCCDGICQKEDCDECSLSLVYGEDSEQVELLRKYRDGVLSTTPVGQEIIKLYYLWSPLIVKAMEADEDFKEDVKELVDGVLGMVE